MAELIQAISPEAEIRSVEDVEWVFYDNQPIVELGRKKALEDSWCHQEPGYIIGRCKMIKRDGQRCRNAVRKGWTVCHYHGAGRPSKPGGMTLSQTSTGRHSKHLPDRLLEKYRKYILDPESLSMAAEIALIDSRIAERLEMLDSSDVKNAWMKVRQAYAILQRKTVSDDDLIDVVGLMEESLAAKQADENVWQEVLVFVEQRRKIAETERRRIVDAQQTMTYQEANMLVAFLMNSVMEHVQDPEIRRAISEDMKRVML
jgi:hypothetical protein